MSQYLIICRSLTHAQRTARALEKAGINGYVMRAPKAISADGCNYCVKVAERKLGDALRCLHRENLEPKRVYMQNEEMYQEVGI